MFAICFIIVILILVGEYKFVNQPMMKEVTEVLARAGHLSSER